jgi:alpha-glucuronidase
MRHVLIGLAAVGILGVVPAIGRAETGRDAWLRYQRLTGAAATRAAATPAAVVALGAAPTVTSARDELARGMLGMTGRAMRVESAIPAGGALVVGTAEAIAAADPAFAAALAGAPVLPGDGYRLNNVKAR